MLFWWTLIGGGRAYGPLYFRPTGKDAFLTGVNYPVCPVVRSILRGLSRITRQLELGPRYKGFRNGNKYHSPCDKGLLGRDMDHIRRNNDL